MKKLNTAIADFLRRVAWKIDWSMSSNKPNFLVMWEKDWNVFLNFTLHNWIHALKVRYGVLKPMYAPNTVMFMASRYHIDNKLETAKELVEIKEENKRQGRIRNAEAFEMTFTKRSHGYNKKWFHRGDPGTEAQTFLKGKARS